MDASGATILPRLTQRSSQKGVEENFNARLSMELEDMSLLRGDDTKGGDVRE